MQIRFQVVHHIRIEISKQEVIYVNKEVYTLTSITFRENWIIVATLLIFWVNQGSSQF